MDILSFLVTYIVRPLAILVVGKVLVDVVMKLFNKVSDKAKVEVGMKGFLGKIVKVIVWVFVGLIVAESLGIDTTSLVAVISVVSLALSLSFQSLMTNLISGAVILITKPFVVGNYVDVAGTSGTVDSVSLFKTILRTPDNKKVMIPNANIDTSNIINYSSEEFRRVDVNMKVSADNKHSEVVAALSAALKDIEDIVVGDGYGTQVVATGFADNGVEYSARAWVRSEDYWKVYFAMIENIRESFDNNSISGPAIRNSISGK